MPRVLLPSWQILEAKTNPSRGRYRLVHVLIMRVSARACFMSWPTGGLSRLGRPVPVPPGGLTPVPPGIRWRPLGDRFCATCAPENCVPPAPRAPGPPTEALRIKLRTSGAEQGDVHARRVFRQGFWRRLRLSPGGTAVRADRGARQPGAPPARAGARTELNVSRARGADSRSRPSYGRHRPTAGPRRSPPGRRNRR